MKLKVNISQANYKGDQLCALLAIMNNSGSQDDDVTESLIALAFDLSVEVSAILIELDKKSGVK
ncbi:hypothetical protein [Pantoea sp. BAV 3049]|uniref:hypothetical protein n=1 Tax=Pantoea sp. BAV 3049 TaxID=2654188 RepID=UPI00131DE3CD|nr:hypothetical protein [Pantoea sp. BAV 3049]